MSRNMNERGRSEAPLRRECYNSARMDGIAQVFLGPPSASRSLRDSIRPRTVLNRGMLAVVEF
jgi:hypothetical protein